MHVLTGKVIGSLTSDSAMVTARPTNFISRADAAAFFNGEVSSFASLPFPKTEPKMIFEKLYLSLLILVCVYQVVLITQIAVWFSYIANSLNMCIAFTA